MNRAKKLMVVALATLGLGLGVAQAQMGGWGNPEHCGAGMRRPDPAKMSKFMEQRMTKVHDALKLTPAQETAWTALVDKVKPMGPANRPDMAELAKLATPERLDRMEALAKERQARMSARSAAVKEFYGQLTPEQQKTFDAEFMKLARDGMRGGRPGGDGRPGRPSKKPE